MSYKTKLCWKWGGTSDIKTKWLEICAKNLAEHFEIFCEESESLELKSFGLEPTSPGCDWGRGSQYLLLSMIASGEAKAVVWIDDMIGDENMSMQALKLARSHLIPIGLEPAGAAAILASLSVLDGLIVEKDVGELQEVSSSKKGGENHDILSNDLSPSVQEIHELTTKNPSDEGESFESELSDIEWFEEHDWFDLSLAAEAGVVDEVLRCEVGNTGVQSLAGVPDPCEVRREGEISSIKVNLPAKKISLRTHLRAKNSKKTGGTVSKKKKITGKRK